MEESRKLSGRDLITIGIFSAIYFVLNLAAMITGFVRCCGCCYRAWQGL